MSGGRSKGDDLRVPESIRGCHVDFGFLTTQTFSDRDLERDLLEIFLSQARRVLPLLPEMTARRQGEAAHLLKGSCQGIGAIAAGDVAQCYEDAGPHERAMIYPSLVTAFAQTEAAILAHLAAD